MEARKEVSELLCTNWIRTAKSVQSLFSFRSLSDVETRYWATELEADALVWALTKLPQYFDGGQFTVEWSSTVPL